MKETPLFSWREYEIAQSEAEWRYKIDQKEPEEDRRFKDMEDAVESVFQDQDFWQWTWDDLIDFVEYWLHENEYYAFRCDAHNIGWRNREGYNEFSTEHGDEFLRKIVGFDDSTFEFYEHEPEDHWAGPTGLVLTGTVSHHDSPMGEQREVYLMRYCDFCDSLCFPEDCHEIVTKSRQRYYPGLGDRANSNVVCSSCFEDTQIDDEIAKVLR